MSGSTIFGIDLGTTYSCIAYVDEVGRPVVIPNDENELVTPSVVYFESPGNVIVGRIAKEAARVHPDDVVELIKRSMGDSNYRRIIHGHEYRPEEISAIILRRLRDDAQKQLNQPVTDAVITVPAYFNEAQRTATEQAGQLAGLNVRAILPEPTAAAIAYALTEKSRQTVLVYDLGGGTFDVTVMEIGDNAVRVVCIGGDHDLGGRNWDEHLVAFFAEEWKRQTGRFEDPLDDPETAQEFLNAAESAKRRLTRVPKTPVSLSHAGDKARVELNRTRFDELTASLLERTLSLTRDTLQEASRKGVSRIDRVILVGGSSYMPQVVHRLTAELGVECDLFDPEQSVAKGAALYAANRMIQDTYREVLQELFGPAAPATPHGLPPAQQQRVQEIVGARLPDYELDLLDPMRPMTIVNACSKSFGIVALDPGGREVVAYLIRKNDPVPSRKDQDFETVETSQTTAEVRIIETEGETPSEDPRHPSCHEIKRSMLHLPPGLPAGSLIGVSYSLSEDGGRLRVVATEKKTGRSLEVDVTTVDALTAVEMEEKKEKLLKLKVS
jgi:molecular chaperone DnaK (HSP70)